MNWMILPLKRYAEFRGRSQRKELWMWILFQVILYTVLIAIMFGTVGMQNFRPGATPANSIAMLSTFGALGLVLGLIWLGFLVPNIAVQVRLHDIDRTGWWIMLWAGPSILGFFVSLTLLSSLSAPNQFSHGFIVFSYFVSLVRFIGSIVLLVFFCIDGTHGPNRFGPDPKGKARDLAETFS